MVTDPHDAGPRPARPDDRLAAVAVQGAATVAAITLVMVVGRGRTFFFDEWDWVQHRSQGGLETLMRPHNGHLMPLPVALYRLQFELVGFAPAWPVRFVTIAGHVAAAGVLYRLARVRVGVAGAAAVALVFLGLGAAWQTLLWGIQLSVTLAVLGGLVAWLALDREPEPQTSRRASRSSLRPPASPSARSLPWRSPLSSRSSRRLRTSWWVPAVPLGLFAVAYLTYGDSGLTAAGVRGAVGWAVDAAAAAAGGLAVLGPSWGRILLVVLVAGLVVAALRRRSTPRLAGLLVAGVLFWTLTGASRSSGLHADSPLASRYVEIGAPIVLLVTVELCRGRTLAGWWRVPVAARRRHLRLARHERAGRAGRRVAPQLRRRSWPAVAAIEIARPHVDPDLIPLPDRRPADPGRGLLPGGRRGRQLAGRRSRRPARRAARTRPADRRRAARRDRAARHARARRPRRLSRRHAATTLVDLRPGRPSDRRDCRPRRHARTCDDSPRSSRPHRRCPSRRTARPWSRCSPTERSRPWQVGVSSPAPFRVCPA